MQEQVQIRNASVDDFQRIVDLENICFSNELAYSRRQLRYLLIKANSTVLVETINKRLRGFIIILFRRGTKVAGIESINVDPAYRKQGIGLRLLSAAEHEMRKRGIHKIRLEVSIANQAALKMYERAGFKKIDLLRNYYLYDHGGSRDAYRMIKELA